MKSLLAAAVGLCLGLWLSGCFQAPEAKGPYRCTTDGECALPGYVCDDGVCCNPSGEPMCRSYVLDGGRCQDGSEPETYYEDLDRDGFGNENHPRLYCAPPLFDLFVKQGGDCNDNPEASGALFFPDAGEQCDGLDNNCDGVADEGLSPLHPYWPDLDGDGHGDADAGAEMLCAARAGVAPDNADCNDGDPAIHPGVVETCNGKDDDCNGQIDDIPNLGGACEVTLHPNCAPGRLACGDGGTVCEPQLSTEICDQLDNDCDGQIDERPDCRGPVSFGTESDVVFKARRLATTYGGTVSECPSALAASSGTQDSFDGGTWVGTGATSHVGWVERKQATWDLTWTTWLNFKLKYAITTSASRAWDQHYQPVIVVCGQNPTEFIRLVHEGFLLGTADAGSLNMNVPLDGGLGWVVASGSSPDRGAVLQHAQKIEFLIQPESTTNGVAPSFIITFSALGFP